MKKQHISKKWSILALLLTLTQATVAFAGSQPSQIEQVIKNTVSAYGGNHLLNLKSLALEEKYIGFSDGQSTDPDEVDKGDYHVKVAVDFKNGRKDFRWIRGNKASYSIMHQLYNGNTGYRIDHDAKTKSQSSGLNFANVDRRHLYSLDAFLVKLMHENGTSAKYDGEINLYGDRHHQVSFQAEGYPEMTLYIDQKTNLVTKMKRAHWVPGQFYYYHYSLPEKAQHIQYATDTYVTRNGQPYSVTVSRRVQVKDLPDSYFDLPENYNDAPESLDFSEMSVQQIAENTYLAGKGWGFSIFVDVGSYFVAAGGYDGLTERYKAMKAFAGLDKPLKYFVVSHHHTDHLGGMAEVAKLGANFITVGEHIARIREMAETDLPDGRFITIDKQSNFFDGVLRVIDFPNGHSTHNLMSYFPASQVLFSADFYITRQKEGVPYGHSGLQKFKKLLVAEDIQVELFAAAHSGRVLTADDFEKSLKKTRESNCPQYWEICTAM